MNYSKRTVHLIMLLSAMIALGLGVSLPDTALAQDDEITTLLVERMDRAVNEGFSGAVLYTKEGEILLREAYGLADSTWNIPNTTETRFLISALTKQFTALAILRLHEDDELSVEDAICDYLDDCPEAWLPITIHHVLTDSSGLDDYRDFSLAGDGPPTPSAAIEAITATPLLFEPGSMWAYNQTGYLLLAEVIEQVSGSNYAEYLATTFFEPLGMENTGLATNNEVVSDLASLYVGDGVRAPAINFNLLHSAAGMYSTVDDLYVWNQALVNSEIVSEETFEMMWENDVMVVEELNWSTAYGLNQTIKAELNDERILWFGGGIIGLPSALHYYYDADVHIIILSNSVQYNLLNFFPEDILVTP